MSIHLKRLVLICCSLFSLPSIGFSQQKLPTAASQFSQDEEYLYVLQGKWQLKFEKSDLKPAANQVYLGEPEFVPKGKAVKERRVSNGDVHQTLLKFFTSQEISCSISSEVSGTVSVDLNNVPFEVALSEILTQADAMFHIEAGVYKIIPASPPKLRNPSKPYPDFTDERLGGGPPFFELPPANNLMLQDAKSLYVLQGNMLFKVQVADMKVVATETVFYRGWRKEGK